MYKLRLYFIFFTFLFAFSCGVLLDSNRIDGKWELQSTEFYVYNAAINANKTYKGTDDSEPSDENPLNSEFFFRQDDYTYILEFQGKDNFRIYFKDNNNNENEIVKFRNFPRGYYNINTFDNTLMLTVVTNASTKNNPNLNAKGIWLDGFEIKNSWPMPNYTTLEITINAKDVDKSYFKIHLEDETVKAQSMKAIFIKTND